jgi:AraC-like DNA-binding protein
MEDYNKIIESLGVHFKKANNIKIKQAITIENYYDVENALFRINKGEIRYTDEGRVAKKGDLLFVPGGKNIKITFGEDGEISLTNDDFISKKEDFFESLTFDEVKKAEEDNFSYVNFDAKVFDSVNFFASLDIPPFLIKDEHQICQTIDTILQESSSGLPGSDRIIMLVTDQLVVEIIRYILVNNLFVEQLATNSTYFKDPRLIDIFSYIGENLSGDLSNKNLANIANVSEDYVGQYFKMLTGINPQDYIEYQRMEEAVNLLRTTKKSIREIGHEVGYKDTAYFCRRFKMMFGIPAGKMRRRESLMNI